jgi:hypothetical protein
MTSALCLGWKPFLLIYLVSNYNLFYFESNLVSDYPFWSSYFEISIRFLLLSFCVCSSTDQFDDAEVR